MAEPAKSEAPAPPQDATSPPSPEDSRMPFVEHLRELRIRLRNAVLALIVGMVIAFYFKEELFNFAAGPLREAWSHYPSLPDFGLIYYDLLAPFWTYFSVALWGGVFISSPVIFYQLWKFVAPGLYARERRWGMMFVLSSVVLFLAGAAFCYFVVLPIAFEFLLGYGAAETASGVPLQAKPEMRTYLSLTRRLMLAFGVIFELPLGMLFLSLAGMITHRTLIKHTRWAILLSFIIGAILTPTPDPLAQLAMAGATMTLYALSIGISYLVTRRREQKQAALGL